MEHLECIWTKCGTGRGAERFFFLAVLEFFFLAIASFPLCHKCIRVARGDGHGPRAKLRDAICELATKRNCIRASQVEPLTPSAPPGLRAVQQRGGAVGDVAHRIDH